MGGMCVTKNRQEPEINQEDQTQPLQVQQQLEPLEEQQAQPEKQEPIINSQQQLDQDRKRKENKKMAKIAAVGDKQEIFENVTIREKIKSPFDFQLILNAFNYHFLFNQLQPSDQEKIIEKMFYCNINDQEFVFKQGDKASSYFLIERGQCQIIINNEIKKVIKSKDAFGELALLYNAPRSASVKAIGDCGFWAIDRNTFRRVIEDISLKDYEENKNFISKVKFFESLTEDQKDSISSVLITLVYKKGEIIVSEGDMANSFFIIKKGKVSAVKDNKELRQMNEGDSFGEQALFENSVRGATVKACEENVKCLALAREDLQRILGDKIQVIMYNNLQLWALEKHALLSKLTKIQMEKIIENSYHVQYKDGDIVLSDQMNKLIIVLEGKLVQSGKVLAEKGQLFGDQYLNNTSAKLSNSIAIQGNGLLAQLEFKKFFEIIGGPLEQIFKKNENSHEVKYMKNKNTEQNSSQKFNLEDFIYIQKLGAGQFGNVYQVHNQQDQKIYALKCISKAQVVEQTLEKHLAQEKKVLQTINFPFMMKYFGSFKDKNYIYFLEEYIRGMELFDVIRDIGLLGTFDSQFYTGSLIVCIEYLHMNHIIYRDIKPENIMVDDKGYMKLIDMGTGKFLQGNRTYTIIGTPHYMAPEILTGKGYTFSVDLWSIGICLYEFMCGGVPYAEDADDPYEIYEEIIKKPLGYPSFLKDKKARKFMDQLINKTPELRLGRSYAALKANSWFDQFDWDKLMDKELKPPYVPPKSKLIAEKDVQKQIQLKKKIVNEIPNLPVYDKLKAKNPNWDEDY